ncbi:GGDEF domain-containing protein [Telmatocola sphagniphila]|uniref:diguanylate cyclase n=2 Tax=Telmatocola sphagniphila TaxID=1123043 RepID=A0A8E6BDE5_9BACT|nr:GGDEF domain-containing protein [Telmatocola sphagniphila]
MPLATPEGHNLGTLCVIDRVPRTLTNTQSDALRVLARHVVTQLMLRRQLEWSKVIEAELRASEAKFRNTVDRLAEGVFVVDPLARKIIDANLAVLAILGYTKSEFVGRSPEDIMAQEIPEVTTRNFSRIDSELATTGRRNLGRKCLRGKDGSLISVDVRITLIPNDGVGLQAFVIRDLTEQCAYEDRLFLYQTELENANAKLKQLANTDGLTGVRNRSAFNAKLLEEYDRANRYNHPLSVILMDVDHFKIFNDTFGHPAGDEVLKAVGRTLQETARSTDFVARYGGEEFAVLLPDTELSGAMVLAERFRRAIASVSWDKRAVTVSVGVSTSTKQTPEASKLVQEADEALYRSKKNGRNRVNHSNLSSLSIRNTIA